VGYAQAERPHGLNPVSLDVARRNFRVFGACEERMIRHTRRPSSEERP
jgi:hypothetical protein